MATLGPLCWQKRIPPEFGSVLTGNIKDIKEKLFKKSELSIIKHGKITAKSYNDSPLQRKVKILEFKTHQFEQKIVGTNNQAVQK
jgi:hypothetical protein